MAMLISIYQLFSLSLSLLLFLPLFTRFLLVYPLIRLRRQILGLSFFLVPLKPMPAPPSLHLHSVRAPAPILYPPYYSFPRVYHYTQRNRDKPLNCSVVTSYLNSLTHSLGLFLRRVMLMRCFSLPTQFPAFTISFPQTFIN